MSRLPISTLALCAAMFPLGVTAQEAQAPVTLDPIILSGGLSPIAADAYGRANTVLTAEAMERQGIRSVREALRSVPGLSVSSAGASLTQVRIRGAEANHTLILIDGVPATGGNDEYILSGLATDNIDRIEVLRGPQSVYYGSNASAGVINIITKRGDLGTHYGGRIELGNGYGVSGWFTQRTARGGLSFTASKRDDHGYDHSGDHGEKDGIDRASIGLTGDWQPTDDITLGFTLRRSQEKYESDSSAYSVMNDDGIFEVRDGAGNLVTDADGYIYDDLAPHSERNELTASVWAEYVTLDGRMTHRLEYQDTVFKQSYDDWPATRGETQALKYRLGLSLDGQAYDQARHLVNLMLERVEDKNNQASDYNRANNSVALEYRGFFDNGLDVQAGLRRDNFDQFDDFTSWNIGLSWKMPDAPLRLHASAGRGLVKPSYYELFANDVYTLGNPNLKPERNSGYDIGIEAEILQGRGTVDLTYFNEDLEDEIDYVFGTVTDGSFRSSYINAEGKSPREGIELSGQLQASDNLHLGVNYTYLDAKNRDGSVKIRRPRHELGLRASYDLLDGRANISGDLRYVSGNFDNQFWGAFATEELPSYTVVNIAGGYDINENLRATARVVNLFDKDYMDVWGYASQGRTAYIGLETKW